MEAFLNAHGDVAIRLFLVFGALPAMMLVFWLNDRKRHVENAERAEQERQRIAAIVRAECDRVLNEQNATPSSSKDHNETRQ